MGHHKQHGGKTAPPPAVPDISHAEYQDELVKLQIELVKLQRDVIGENRRILIILEGRDAAGKDGAIKRIVKHMSPRETRVVALPKPSDRQVGEWYFQRYIAQLPTAQELVLFNRSWYNRAGVERVMGFCTDAEYEEFMPAVVDLEALLIRSGITIVKYYLDIGKAEQKRRLKDRQRSPLKQWKVSPIDDQANKLWDDYSRARNAMFARTHTLASPWHIVRANDKRQARLNLIRDLLTRLDYPGADESLLTPNPNVVFTYDDAYLHNGMIAP
ncbi:MAG TPA: polyphosphate kinase 2 [Alphaproteobacteria bacterium]|jgi:polyphosphate kinase 2|nr:polyphosphate kinase 2 [Alphaproteobacteria bacterium]